MHQAASAGSHEAAQEQVPIQIAEEGGFPQETRSGQCHAALPEGEQAEEGAVQLQGRLDCCESARGVAAVA